jgi:thiol-disulfide isomerase/thioredoxin
VLGGTAALGACHSGTAEPPASPGKSPATSPPSTGDDRRETIAFIEDDYERARSTANRMHRPLFVDAWATWCHTCLSMREYVFNDPALAPLAPKFVWASIDTEKPESAAFLQKFPVQAWPTLWVIDPASEKAVLKWPGSATPEELVVLLGEVTEALGEAPRASTAATMEATAAWLRGNRFVADGHPVDASREYENALARAPADWPKRPRVVEALITALEMSQQNEACVTLATREWPAMPRGTSRLNLGLYGLECGMMLGKDERPREPLRTLADSLEKVARDASEPILADDRSSLFEVLVSYFRSVRDPERVKTVAREWADFLDAEVARAPSPSARAVFDTHRMLAYEAVGTPEKAVAALEQSERDFPTDYNPPARLAGVYLRMGRLDAALSAVERAESKVYGPRTLRVLALKADILKAMKRPADEKNELARAVRLGESYHLTGGYTQLLNDLKTRVAGHP